MNTTITDLFFSCINMNFLSLLVKSISPKNKSGFALYGNPPRWHKISSAVAIPKGSPIAAHPHAAGAPVPAKHFTDEEWGKLHLPDSNVNAATHNKQVQKLKEHSESGDVTAILGSSYGSNNYAKKIVITANHLLKLHGSPHTVSVGQKAGEHDAVQNAPKMGIAGTYTDLTGKTKVINSKKDETGILSDAANGWLYGYQWDTNNEHPDNVLNPIPSDAVIKELSAFVGVKPIKLYRAVAVAHDDSGKLLESWTTNKKHATNLKDANAELGQKMKVISKVFNPDQIIIDTTKLPKSHHLENESGTQDEVIVALGSFHDKLKAVRSGQSFLSKDEAISEAIDHLTEDSKQADMPANEKAEDAALIAKLKTAQDSSPKDGDTKAGVDGGVLTFKDGYWHKAASSSLPPYADALYAAAEKHPVISGNGLIECHVAVADMVSAISFGQVIVPDGVPVFAYNYDELKGEEFTENLKKTTPPSVKSEAASFLLEDLLDQSINGHSFLKVGDHFIDPHLKSGGAPQDEIDKIGHYLTKVFTKTGITPYEVKSTPLPAVKHVSLSKVALIPWDKQYLPDTNSNAATHNKAVAKIKAMADAGDVAGLKAFVDGKANAKQTYAKKQGLLAATALAALTEGDVPPPVAAPVLSDKLGKIAAMVAKVVESSKSPDLPAIPKFKDMNHEMVAKQWVKLINSGDVSAFNTSVKKLTESIKSKPSMGNDSDVQALVLFALALTKHNKAKGTPSAVVEPTPVPDSPVSFETFHNTNDKHNKFWSVAVVGNKIHKHYGAIGSKGQTLVAEYPTHEAAKKQAAKEKAVKTSNGYVAVTASAPLPSKPLVTSNNLSSVVSDVEEALKNKNLKELLQLKAAWASLSGVQIDALKKYIDDGISFLGGNVTNQKDTPKDGDTKQGADGMLVFKNGRWHKQGGDSSDGNNNDPILESFIHSLINHETPSYSDALHVKGKYLDMDEHELLIDALSGFLPEDFEIDGVNMDFDPQGVLEKVTDTLYDVLAAGPSASQPYSTTSVDAESMDSWIQVGQQQGSNNGGKFKDESGQEWYCKFPNNEDIARSELLASKLYELAGVTGQDAKLIIRNGKIGIASRWVEVSSTTPSKLKKVDGVLSGFAVDAWLANWDVIGAGYDNLQVGADGKAVRVDAGGSLNYRAQGAKKQFGDSVIEIDSMRDKDVNPQAAAVFGLMTVADITASVSRVVALKDEDIKLLVDSYAGGTAGSRATLYNTLIARKADLLAKYPKAANKPKKKLDPSKLPVKESDLPSTHDFSNWNGDGSGLSSYDVINKSNEQVEQQIKAMALSGNLLALQDFKFSKIDKETGNPTGEMDVMINHPSKHAIQYYMDTLSALEEIANPPTALEITKTTGVGSLSKIMAAFPPKKFGTTINHVAANEKLGFWIALGGVSGDVSKLRPPVNLPYSESAKKAAYIKFEQGTKLAQHFIIRVQKSKAYNELFRLGHKVDFKGNSLAAVAKAALDHSTTQPAGTTLYRWQEMTDDMVKKVLSAPDGTVIQATGPMCTSYHPTATASFGKHRVVIRYAEGARGVDSFGSGGYETEMEVTTLPNNRFVVLSKKMVPNTEHSYGSGMRLELELLMLPPDLGI